MLNIIITCHVIARSVRHRTANRTKMRERKTFEDATCTAPCYGTRGVASSQIEQRPLSLSLCLRVYVPTCLPLSPDPHCHSLTLRGAGETGLHSVEPDEQPECPAVVGEPGLQTLLVHALRKRFDLAPSPQGGKSREPENHCHK